MAQLLGYLEERDIIGKEQTGLGMPQVIGH
jgi:hypothetical protein